MEKIETPKSEYRLSPEEERITREIHGIKHLYAGTREGLFRWFTEMPKFAGALESRYPDARTYRLFHLLIDSTPPPGVIAHFDFPGEDSIEKFIRGYKE